MDPLTLLAAAIAAGIVSTESSGSDRREAVLRIRRVPKRFTTSPWPFVRGYSLETEDPAESDGIWHVTTALRSVLRDGLLPRSRTGKVGLGGGPSHQAPDEVSAVTQHDAALRVYRAMRLAIEAANDQISVRDILAEVIDQNHVAISIVCDYESFLSEGGDLAEGQGLGFALGETVGLGGTDVLLDESWRRNEQVGRALDGAFPTGKDKYELISKLEEDVLDALEPAEANAEEKSPCSAPVGFTAPWQRFVQIEPLEVAILQLAVDRRAVVDHVPTECELRFLSHEDLVVVGWERPDWKVHRVEREEVLEARRKIGRARRSRPDLPSPTAFLDDGMQGGFVFETTDLDMVIRVGPPDEKQDQISYFAETGGVVQEYDRVLVDGDIVVSWRERVEPAVEWWILRRYADRADELLRALIHLHSPERWVMDTLKRYRATYGLYLAIREGLPTDDLDLRSNLGVTKDGRVVAYDL